LHFSKNNYIVNTRQLKFFLVVLQDVRFDLVKNRGLDITTFIVSCLIQKLIMVLEKIASKG
jgi:hypothetical protein